MTTEEMIAEVRVLDVAATPGPWKVERFGEPINWSVDGPDGQSVCYTDAADINQQGKDAALIANYRTLAPALADALEVSEGGLTEACKDVERLTSERDQARADLARLAALL